MDLSMATPIQTSAQRLFPNLSMDQILARLLLEHAKKNLIKYRSMTREFETKYEQDFDAFRRIILNTEPDFKLEQDYFDWEMAVTGVTDMQEEIKRLRTLTPSS